MFCGSCGAAVKPGSKFCGKCGAAVQPPAQDAAPVNDAPADATIVRPSQSFAAPPVTPPSAAPSTPPAYTPPPVATPPMAQAPAAPAPFAPPAQAGFPAAPPAYGAPAAAGIHVKFNVGAWSLFDYIALGSGLLFFILSFIGGFFHLSVPGGFDPGTSFSHNAGSAWHSWGWLGTILVIAAVVLVLLKAVDGLVPANPIVAWVTVGAAGLGWLLLTVFAWTYNSFDTGDGTWNSLSDVDQYGFGVGPGWSAWILMVLGLVIIGALATPLIQAVMGNRPAPAPQFAQPSFPPPAYQPPTQPVPPAQAPSTDYPQPPTQFPPPPA